MDEATLTLRAERRARIVAGLGSLARLPKLISGLNPYRVALIVDGNVPWSIVEAVRDGLESIGIPASVLRVKGGEAAKTIESVEAMWRFMAREGVTRDSMVLAVGGGGLLDAAGFAAATYMRGIMLAYLPTTTLAQADAAVGGKTAIDLGWAKNLIGAFYHPDLVVIDPSILGGLPEEAYTPGFAEVVKHAVIKGGWWLSWLKSRAEGVKSRDPKTLDEVIRFSVSVKLEVIKRDYVERGYRAVLNFGHTVGHAVEAASSYRVSHGYAVSMGLAAESRLAVEVTGLPEGEAAEVEWALRALGLPTRIPLPPSLLVDAMRLDKKFARGRPRIPLPRRLGDFSVVELDWEMVKSWLSRVTRT